MLNRFQDNTVIMKLVTVEVGSGITISEHERGWVELFT